MANGHNHEEYSKMKKEQDKKIQDALKKQKRQERKEVKQKTGKKAPPWLIF